MNKKEEDLCQSKYNSLWNNEMINYAKKNMSKEELSHYTKLGESLFKDIDFETCNVSEKEKACPKFMLDYVAYLSEAIKSGLHPSMLTEEEKEALKSFYGENWFVQFGYVEDDLTDIVTLEKN